MKYREIKEKLETNGFYMEAYQSDYELPMLHFEHTNMKGSNWGITLVFSHDVNINDYVKDNEEYSLVDGWILDMEIIRVEFSYDIGISYMSEDLMPTCGEGDENLIIYII